MKNLIKYTLGLFFLIPLSIIRLIILIPVAMLDFIIFAGYITISGSYNGIFLSDTILDDLVNLWRPIK